MIGAGYTDRFLRQEEIVNLMEEGLANLNLRDQRVLVLIPDGTRTMPLPLFVGLFERFLAPITKSLDYLVALGTHQPMRDEHLSKLIGRVVKNGVAGHSHVFNHEWNDPTSFIDIGDIPAGEISVLTEGMLSEVVPVRLNKRIQEYDHMLICGPVFPHEVVGFSGGNKYFFPGIAGAEIINFTHWLGALLTSHEIIGLAYTPVRAVIDRAADFISKPVACFSSVVTHNGVSGLYCGSAKESWSAAAALSAQKHIVYSDKPFQKIIAVMPRIYDDLWTAAKGMYKLDPVCADGGEIIIYAPHITEVSYTYGKLLDEIGYHCCDYFVKQWSAFEKFPRGALAHSTHLRGIGTFDEKSRIEQSRIQVTLATGIPELRCKKIGLGYLDPASFDPDQWTGREDQGILVVQRAGEMLYRLKEQVKRDQSHDRK